MTQATISSAQFRASSTTLSGWSAMGGSFGSSGMAQARQSQEDQRPLVPPARQRRRVAQALDHDARQLPRQFGRLLGRRDDVTAASDPLAQARPFYDNGHGLADPEREGV